jgi:hypothetical protein
MAYSPVVEIVTIYFPIDIARTSRDRVVSATKEFRDILQGNGGCIASSGGWILEEVSIPGHEEKGKAFIMTIGWSSVEDHDEFVKTPIVQSHAHLIGDLVGMISLTMCHVSLTEVGK